MSMMATFMASLPPSMVPRAMAPMRFSSLCSSSLGMTTLPSVAGISVSGTSILAMQDGSRRGHDDGGEQVARLDALRDVHAAMMPPETWAMPLVMMVISSLRVALARNGRMVSGASVWPMKMRGGHVHAFRAGDAHGLEHDPGHGADDDLHHADVVEHGEEGGDEDDGGQHLEGEDGAGLGADCRRRRSWEGRAAPKRTLVPAKVQASMVLTTPPAQVMARWP